MPLAQIGDARGRDYGRSRIAPLAGAMFPTAAIGAARRRDRMKPSGKEAIPDVRRRDRPLSLKDRGAEADDAGPVTGIDTEGGARLPAGDLLRHAGLLGQRE